MTFDLYQVEGFPNITVEQDGNQNGIIVGYEWYPYPILTDCEDDDDNRGDAVWGFTVQDDGSDYTISVAVNSLNVDFDELGVDKKELIAALQKHFELSVEAEMDEFDDDDYFEY